MSRPVVRAAGGVVWRQDPDGRRIAVVHRPPPRDDWSLPKGKLDAGERHRDAAVREVWEETGLRCALGTPLGEVRYDTPHGEDKRVRYWEMTVLRDDGFTPGSEVDALRWVLLDEVDGLVSWSSDRRVLERFRQV